MHRLIRSEIDTNPCHASATEVLLLLGCLLLLMFVFAPTTNAQGLLSKVLVEEKIEELTLSQTLTEDQRVAAIGKLGSAIKLLDKASRFRASAEESMAAAAKVAADVQYFEGQLALAKANPVEPDSLVDPSAGTEQIESQLALLETKRRALAEQRTELLKATDGWPGRRDAIQKRLVELQTLIDETDPPEPASADQPLQQATHILARANLQALQAEQQSLEQEMLNRPAMLERNSAERDWVAQALEDVGLRIDVYNAAADAAREQSNREKLESVAAIKEELKQFPTELQAYADRNQDLARQLELLSSELDVARVDARYMQAQLEEIEQDSILMNRRLDVAGRKEILGRVMLSRLNKLPGSDMVNRYIGERNDQIAERSLNYIDADEESRALNSRQRYIADQLPGLDPSDPETMDVLERLLDQRKQLLQDGSEGLKTLLRTLVENNETARNLIAVSDRFRQFLVGNLMWVRNFTDFSPKTLFAQTRILFSLEDWALLPQNLLNGYRQHGWSVALIFVLILITVLVRPMKAAFTSRIREPALLNGATLVNIALCLLLTAGIALPWPMLLYVSSFFLSAAQPSTPFLAALTFALSTTAYSLYLLLFTRLLIRPMGVGRRLLKWDTRVLESVRRQLEWAGPLIVMAIFFNAFSINLDIAASGGALGAIATATISSTFFVFCWRLRREESFTLDRNISMALQLAEVLSAIVLVLLLLGLQFAAKTYLAALCWSIIAVLGITLLINIMERALLIMRSRLERKTREELRTQEETGEEDGGDVEGRVDVDYLSEAHAKLLNLALLVAVAGALWMIWAPSLPALNLFDSVALWQVSDPTSLEGGIRTVTLFDLMVGVLVIIVTALIAKHLPAIIQLFLLEWVNVGAGARYASSILMQYFVVAVGASLFLSTVGWDWANLQWLVAALGVGIGFGLQEIVANFISGIIILFEQPIRVGDIISAGGAEGTVKKISARATVIETFEGKEHLIPNKELITGQVVNWSLSESSVRVVIPIGVAYGSDVRKAMALLVEAAHEVDRVLTEPAPRATFEDFGDNALVLWLRCHVEEDRPGAWTELRTCINDKFTEAGIVIAFPQRDIHLDFVESLKVELT